jgi:hypothetical protein
MISQLSHVLRYWRVLAQLSDVNNNSSVLHNKIVKIHFEKASYFLAKKFRSTRIASLTFIIDFCVQTSQLRAYWAWCNIYRRPVSVTYPVLLSEGHTCIGSELQGWVGRGICGKKPQNKAPASV